MVDFDADATLKKEIPQWIVKDINGIKNCHYFREIHDSSLQFRKC